MSERAREPLFFDHADDELEPEPAADGAGTGGPPTAVGSGFGEGGEDEPPFDFVVVRRYGAGGRRRSREVPLVTRIRRGLWQRKTQGWVRGIASAYG